jgi:ribosomal protein S18 acetylase RimI-like enzyme
MGDFEFVNGGSELLNLVQPLWEKLNEHHKNKSSYFKGRYKNFKFEVRKDKFINNNTSAINVDLIKKSGIYIGYCISTINKDSIGEIESLFIDNEYRKFGLGDKLMTRALNWLNINNVKTKIIGVAEGNENVFGFYEKYGFYKRMITLEQINK